MICRQLRADAPPSPFGAVFNGRSGWDLSSWEAFGLSHVSLEELEKQVWTSWPWREPRAGHTGEQDLLGEPMLPPPACRGQLCVLGTAPCLGDGSLI